FFSIPLSARLTSELKPATPALILLLAQFSSACAIFTACNSRSHSTGDRLPLLPKLRHTGPSFDLQGGSAPYLTHLAPRFMTQPIRKNRLSQRPSSSLQSNVLPTMVGPSKTQPPIESSKTLQH